MQTKQNKYLTSGILAIALGIAGLLTGTNPAQALTISPPSIEFTVQPGNQAEFVVKLYNEGDTKQELFVDATTFSSGPDEGLPVYDFGTPKEDIATWITLDPAPVVLEPQGRKEITITVDVPADAAPGGHYGIVAFSSKLPAATGANQPQLAITQGIGTLLLVRIEGEVIESAALTAFSTVARTNRLPVTFNTVYQNTGNIHLKPSGEITITGMSKKVVGTIAVNPTKRSTLPKTSRSYDAVWEKGVVTATASNAWGKFWEEYSNERANFGFGKYTATLALTAGQTGGVVTNATTTFIVFPWHVLLVWGLGFIIVLVVLIVLIKRYNKWVVAKSQAGKNQNPPKGTA
ncbi:MAG: hypothetical protein AAB515_01410 [Patescibacteria group bacterium]